MTVAGIKPLTYTIRCDCTNHQTTFPLILLCFLPLISAFCSSSCLKPFEIFLIQALIHSFPFFSSLSFVSISECYHLVGKVFLRMEEMIDRSNFRQMGFRRDIKVLSFTSSWERECVCACIRVCQCACGCMCGREKVQFCPFFCSSSDAISSFLSLNDRASKPT